MTPGKQAPRDAGTRHTTEPPGAKQKAILYGRWAAEKKAAHIVILNMGHISAIAEYFVICSGTSVRHTRALVRHLRKHIKEASHPLPLGVEGEAEGTWILLDCDDVVVHVFHQPLREVYALEKLWSDAPRVTDPEIQAAAEALRNEKEGFDEEDEGWDA